MKKQKINPPIKIAILCITVIIALFFITGYLMVSLKNLDYFRIRDIAVNKPGEAFDFSYLLGRNIFNVDLKKESRYISELYPVYKNITVFRIMPSRLFINLVERSPLACVKLYQYFYVDSERVLFNIPQGSQIQDLPVIIGLEKKIPGPRSGRQYNIKELTTALNIIRETGINIQFKNYKIGRIDITNPANISCFIQKPGPTQGKAATDFQTLEVKMGQDDIVDKIRVLAGLFEQFKDEIGNIKYIDLRFKEPAVRLKDAT